MAESPQFVGQESLRTGLEMSPCSCSKVGHASGRSVDGHEERLGEPVLVSGRCGLETRP